MSEKPSCDDGGSVAADDASAAAGPAAAVDRDAQRSTARRHPDDLLHLLVVLDVAASELGAAAELGRDLLAARLVDVGDDDVGAGRGQPPGGRLAEPGGPAGDDCSHTCEFHAVCLPHRPVRMRN